VSEPPKFSFSDEVPLECGVNPLIMADGGGQHPTGAGTINHFTALILISV